MSEPEWWEEASCRYVDTEVFFPPNYADPRTVAVAVRICDGCPVREVCLTDALAHPEVADRHGIFGGLTPRQRRRRRGSTKTVKQSRPPRDEVRVDVTGTRWRLHALSAIGWANDRLAVELGSTVKELRSARNSRCVTCPEALADRVVAEWPRLVAHAPVGKSARAARLRAAQAGVPRPQDLDLARVDDPDYEPIRQET